MANNSTIATSLLLIVANSSLSRRAADSLDCTREDGVGFKDVTFNAVGRGIVSIDEREDL